MMIVGADWSYCASAKDFGGCDQNCDIFADEFYGGKFHDSSCDGFKLGRWDDIEPIELKRGCKPGRGCRVDEVT